MKLNPSSHGNIFLIACLCFTILLIIAAVTANGDMAAHKLYYERYEAANILFDDGNYSESYGEFKFLASIYDSAYVLELKMAVCAIHMGMWAEAVEHSRRSIELYPLLVKQTDFMDVLSYCLVQLGEDEAAERIEEYYYNMATQ